MLIHLHGTSRPRMSLQKEAVLAPWNFATTYVPSACVLPFVNPFFAFERCLGLLIDVPNFYMQVWNALHLHDKLQGKGLTTKNTHMLYHKSSVRPKSVCDLITRSDGLLCCQKAFRF